MEVELDQDVCVAAGQCVLAAPDVFDQRESDGVSVLRRAPAPAEHAAVRDAASLCPARAIVVRE